MQKEIYAVLRKYWGYDSFREQQEEIIESVLNNNDTLGLLPTGGGKSLTFQVPTMVLPGMTIVITPLISLMKDQVDNLRNRQIKAIYIHSGLKYADIRNAIDKCIYGNYKFLYISPERVASERFLESLRHMKVSLIAVDEAHCISQWGYDFRPSYLKIATIRELFPDVPVLALTATATPVVVNDIMEKLNFRTQSVFKKSFSRTNLSYIVRHVDNKMEKLVNILKQSNGSGIVYVRSRKKTKLVAEELQHFDISADYYHAGIVNEEKQEKQDKWKKGETRIMVATNAFGMGIDKPDVRTVVHLDVPNSLEEYYQEAGRAGRDNKKSYAVMLANNRDKGLLKKRIAETFPPVDFIKEVYVRLCNFLDIGLGGGFDKLFEFNFSLFCETFKYPPTVTHNALKILSQSEYIEYIEEVEIQSRVMVLVDKRSLYDIPNATPLMDNILEIILRNYPGIFADYVFIDEATISYKYGITPDDIYSTLIALNKMHILHYIPRRRTPYVYFPTSRVEPRHLLLPKSVYDEGLKRQEQRIAAISDYAFNDTECRESRMLKYFGETASDCGRCDVCVERKRHKKDNTKEILDGILYMLSLKPCSAKDIVETLSFPDKDIYNMLSYLTDEGFIRLQDGVYYSK